MGFRIYRGLGAWGFSVSGFGFRVYRVQGLGFIGIKNATIHQNPGLQQRGLGLVTRRLRIRCKGTLNGAVIIRKFWACRVEASSVWVLWLYPSIEKYWAFLGSRPFH